MSNLTDNSFTTKKYVDSLVGESKTANEVYLELCLPIGSMIMAPTAPNFGSWESAAISSPECYLGGGNFGERTKGSLRDHSHQILSSIYPSCSDHDGADEYDLFGIEAWDNNNNSKVATAIGSSTSTTDGDINLADNREWFTDIASIFDVGGASSWNIPSAVTKPTEWGDISLWKRVA